MHVTKAELVWFPDAIEKLHEALHPGEIDEARIALSTKQGASNAYKGYISHRDVVEALLIDTLRNDGLDAVLKSENGEWLLLSSDYWETDGAYSPIDRGTIDAKPSATEIGEHHGHRCYLIKSEYERWLKRQFNNPTENKKRPGRPRNTTSNRIIKMRAEANLCFQKDPTVGKRGAARFAVDQARMRGEPISDEQERFMIDNVRKSVVSKSLKSRAK